MLHEVSRAMSFELSSMSPLATRPWCCALVRKTVHRFLITVRRPLTALAETQEMSSAVTFDCDSSLDTSILASSRRAAFLVRDQVLEPAL